MIEPRTRQTRAEVAGHYDELDKVYREVWGEHVHHGYFVLGDESIVEATDAEKAKAAPLALAASRTNLLLSLPMFYTMVNANLG